MKKLGIFTIIGIVTITILKAQSTYFSVEELLQTQKTVSEMTKSIDVYKNIIGMHKKLDEKSRNFAPIENSMVIELFHNYTARLTSFYENRSKLELENFKKKNSNIEHNDEAKDETFPSLVVLGIVNDYFIYSSTDPKIVQKDKQYAKVIYSARAGDLIAGWKVKKIEKNKIVFTKELKEHIENISKYALHIDMINSDNNDKEKKTGIYPKNEI